MMICFFSIFIRKCNMEKFLKKWRHKLCLTTSIYIFLNTFEDSFPIPNIGVV
jgi:hypothetical protein